MKIADIKREIEERLRRAEADEKKALRDLEKGKGDRDKYIFLTNTGYAEALKLPNQKIKPAGKICNYSSSENITQAIPPAPGNVIQLTISHTSPVPRKGTGHFLF